VVRDGRLVEIVAGAALVARPDHDPSIERRHKTEARRVTPRRLPRRWPAWSERPAWPGGPGGSASEPPRRDARPALRSGRTLAHLASAP
jgi:hypothetical protein